MPAAIRVREAGYDDRTPFARRLSLVPILSANLNQRKDEYGGNLRQRSLRNRSITKFGDLGDDFPFPRFPWKKHKGGYTADDGGHSPVNL